MRVLNPQGSTKGRALTANKPLLIGRYVSGRDRVRCAKSPKGWELAPNALNSTCKLVRLTRSNVYRGYTAGPILGPSCGGGVDE